MMATGEKSLPKKVECVDCKQEVPVNLVVIIEKWDEAAKLFTETYQCFECDRAARILERRD